MQGSAFHEFSFLFLSTTEWELGLTASSTSAADLREATSVNSIKLLNSNLRVAIG